MLDDNVLLALAAVMAGTFLLRAVRAPKSRRVGWIAVSALVLVLAAVLAVLQLDGAGWWALGAALLLLVVPGQLGARVDALAFGQRHRAAYWVSAAVRVLHPMDHWGAQVRLLAAQRRVASGDRAEGRAALARMAARADGPDLIRLAARSYLLRVDRDWPAMAALPPSPQTTALRMRGMGELGAVAALVDEFARTEAARRSRLAASALHAALERLLLLAFTGHPRAVAAILAGPLHMMRGDTKALWIATATLAGGDRAAAGTLLRAIVPGDSETEATIAARLGWTPQAVALEPRAQAVVDAAAAEALAIPANRAGAPFVTWALVAINIAVFVAETLSGGSTDDDTLYLFGALWPPAVVADGQYWRLVAAMFLHAGLAHILFNMLALTVIGPPLERRLGAWRYAVLYFGAGLFSMGAVTALAASGVTEASLLVGASGAIMGEIGALAGLALRVPGPDRAAARQALRGALFVILLQSGFDVVVPQVSFAAHASGALAGFLIVLVLPLGRRAGAAHSAGAR